MAALNSSEYCFIFPVYSFAHSYSNKTRHGKTTSILTQGEINHINEPQIKLSEEDRKIAKETTKRLACWVVRRTGTGRSDEEIRSELTNVLKKILKEIRDELENGSLKLDQLPC